MICDLVLGSEVVATRQHSVWMNKNIRKLLPSRVEGRGDACSAAMDPDHLGHLVLQGEGAVPVGEEVQVDGAGVVAALTLSWSGW